MITLKNSPGCFGKLPKFSDFVKFNSGNNELLLFDTWLQNGIEYSKQKLGLGFDATYLKASNVRFVFPIQNSVNSLIGIFISSNDRTGRKYPFIISMPVNSEFDVLKESYLLPLVFEEFYSLSEEIISKIKEYERMDDIIGEIEEKLNLNEINLPKTKRQFEEYITVTTTYKFWNRLFGSFKDEKKYLLINNLITLLLPLRGKEISKFTLGLKIPLGIDSEFLYLNISFWLNICMKIIGKANIQQYLFWQVNSINRKNHLLLFLNQPPQDNYINLIDHTYSMDNICQVEKEGNIKNCKKSLSDNFKRLLEHKELSLDEFLSSI